MIELVVAIALAAILFGFAMPSFERLLGDSRLTSTVNELVFSLQTARSEAIKRAAPVALCASAAPLAAEPVCGGAGYAGGWIVYVDGNGNGTREATADEELILQIEPPGAAFSFVADATVAEQVLFVGSGASATAAGTPIAGSIRVEYAADAGRVVDVSVSANGRIASKATVVAESPS